MTRRYRFDDFEIDLQSFRLLKAGKVVHVEPKALNLLIFLTERPGQMVSRREIIDAVWKEAFVTDHVLNRIIGQLRKGLVDDAKEPRYIETVPTLGYRFIAPVEVESDSLAATQSLTGTSSEAPAAVAQTLQPVRKIWGRRSLRIAVAVAAVLAFGLAVSFGVNHWRSHFEYYRPGYAAQITNFPGLSNYPAFSPDDSAIAYSRDDGKGFEIFVRQLGSDGREIQITSDGGQNMEAAWSPDGKLIAYYSYAKEGIWLVSPIGGPPRQLTKIGSHPSWSPDNQWIVFQSNPISDLSFEGSGFARGSVLWMIHPDGTGEKQLTVSGTPAGGHGDPSWSPDGKYIVFQSENEPYEGLWSIRPDGKGLVDLTPKGSGFLPHDPVFAPDGKSVLYGGAQGLWQIHVSPDTSAPLGEPVQISNSGGMVIKNLALSRDGRKMLYAAEIKTSALQSLAISPRGEPAGEPLELRPDSGCATTLPEFSPDGKHIAFYSCRPGSSGEIWLMNANGTDARQLTSIPSNYSAPTWYPDGRHILYVSGDTAPFKLFSIDSETRQQQEVGELHQAIDRVALSPDGKQIAFDATTGGVWNIWLMDLAGGKTKQITFERDHLAYPLWSRDGRFLSADLENGTDTNLTIFPASGGLVTQLTFDRGDNWSGSWSNDGDKILFAKRPSGGPWNVWSVSRSTKVEKQFTHYNKINMAVYAPAISLRGDQIVYEYSEIKGNIWVLDLDQPK
jgi:Tol biopolymer transport system component/DNA-binding winged helix-turn-helix (wHTH) protein